MDPLDFLEEPELLRFFHCHRTEMSCMEKPHTFLNQLRDHNLIPEDRYKKLIRMKSKDNMKNALYDVLDWLERERPQYIKVFWTCVFKDSILNQYPALRVLRNSLMDGSFQFSQKLPEKVEKEEREEKKRNKPPEEEEEEGEEEEKTGRRKKKLRLNQEKMVDQEEQPGPSSKFALRQKNKPQKPTYSSPLKKGEKKDIWNWAFYKTQLPVTCGDKKGTLSRDKLSKGEKCIMVEDRWFTPPDFEEFAGKRSFKNWKKSIRCMEATLGSLIQDGHLNCPGYKKGNSQRTKAKKSLFPSVGLITVSEEEEGEVDDREEEDQEGATESSDAVEDEEDTEGGPDGSQGSGDKIFDVTCGAIAGTLHKERFASGTCGKSIRTQRSWMTPVEFVREGSTQPDPSWKRDILWEGKPLYVLLERKILGIHSLLCKCRLCEADPKDQEDEKNDDRCFICRSEGDLVVCEQCPRSFHQLCHLPNVEDAILGDDIPWVCTFCVLKASQDWRYPTQLTYDRALSLRISDHLLECQYLLLSLYNSDEDQIFATDPSDHVAGYTDLIVTPMWLDKVAEKLQQNLFQTVRQFVSDVLLIFTNCATFNRNNAEFRDVGIKLKELFDREFKNAFSIQQEDTLL